MVRPPFDRSMQPGVSGVLPVGHVKDGSSVPQEDGVARTAIIWHRCCVARIGRDPEAAVPYTVPLDRPRDDGAHRHRRIHARVEACAVVTVVDELDGAFAIRPLDAAGLSNDIHHLRATERGSRLPGGAGLRTQQSPRDGA